MKERHQLPISWRLDSFTGPLPFRRLQDYLGNVSAFFTTDSIVAPRSKSSSYPGRFLDSTLAAVGYLLLREELPQNRPTAEALFPLSEFSYRSKKRRCTVLLLLWKQSGKKADSSSTYCCRFKLLTCVLAKRHNCACLHKTAVNPGGWKAWTWLHFAALISREDHHIRELSAPEIMCLQPQSYLREAKPVCKHSFFHTPPHHKHPGLGSTFKVQKPKAARRSRGVGKPQHPLPGWDICWRHWRRGLCCSRRSEIILKGGRGERRQRGGSAHRASSWRLTSKALGKVLHQWETQHRILDQEWRIKANKQQQFNSKRGKWSSVRLESSPPFCVRVNI